MIADLFSSPTSPTTRRPLFPKKDIHTADIVFGGVPLSKRPIRRPVFGPHRRPSELKKPVRRPNRHPLFTSPIKNQNQAFTLPIDSLRYTQLYHLTIMHI